MWPGRLLCPLTPEVLHQQCVPLLVAQPLRETPPPCPECSWRPFETEYHLAIRFRVGRSAPTQPCGRIPGWSSFCRRCPPFGEAQGCPLIQSPLPIHSLPPIRKYPSRFLVISFVPRDNPLIWYYPSPQLERLVAFVSPFTPYQPSPRFLFFFSSGWLVQRPCY